MGNEIKVNIFCIADSHLFHNKIIEYGRHPDYQAKILKALSVIKENDVLIHLGDVCIGRDAEANQIFKDLKCRKILVLGNHDGKSLTFYYKYWDFVCDTFTLRYFGKRLLFSHRPQLVSEEYDLNIHGHLHSMMRKDNGTGIDRILEMGFPYDKKYHKLVSMEDNDYKPYLLSSLVK